MKRILLICGALLLTILLLEFAVRAFGTTNANGQFWFRGYTLPPYTLPLSELQAKIDNYLVKRDQATLIPDPATGWTYKPNSTRENGGFMINSAGLRSTRDFTLQPASDTLRIALFGDSFVAGDEVKDDEVWGYNLERLLIQAGTRAEVLNFGVGGYGMGQAFLRWKHQGKDYAPDVVIFVFQAENLDRNANVFRLLYQGGVVYSKPRFILEEDSLALINSPALPPEEIMDVLEGFDSHPLAAHEAFYRGRELSSPIWEISKLAGLLHAALERFFPVSPSEIYGPTSERGKLGKAIVAAFEIDVAASGAEFILLHLPRKDHFKEFHEGKQVSYRHLLDHFQQEYHFISAEDFLGREYTGESYYQPRWHYGPEINLRIAEAVAADLLKCIEDRTCALTRFQGIGDIKS